MDGVADIHSIQAQRSIDILRESYLFLRPLSADYPAFREWYWSQVACGVVDGSRRIVRIERYGELRAVGIAKSDGVERKICTVRVAPDFANRGHGVRLFENLLRWLDTDRPHLSVGQAKLQQFERIFDHYGFVLTKSITDRYRKGMIEHSYNGEESTLTNPKAIAAVSTAFISSASAEAVGS